MNQQQFDVFLCHNNKDKSEVKKIAEKLIQQGLKPWLDEWEFRPGLPWQRELERQIEHIKSAAVFVGSSGFGPWQEHELDAFLREFVNRKCPVIPVLLNTAPQQPKLPIFLQGYMWVDFRQQQPEPMGQLIWGITGVKPQQYTLSISGSKGDNFQQKVEYLYYCQFRAECEQDVDDLLKILGQRVKKITKVKKTRLPDLEVEMCTDLPLEEIQAAMREVEDGHVMLETVELKYDYTGERTYSSANTINAKKEVQVDDLRSEKGIDYTRLRNLLEAGKWREADEETIAVMLQASDREAEGVIDIESIENFPCTDLHTIDQLWIKYSNGRFGFSVQKLIWESIEENSDTDSVQEKPDADYAKECNFGKRVGWRVKKYWIDYPEGMNFSTSAPKGHLPTGGCWSWSKAFFSRIDICRLLHLLL